MGGGLGHGLSLPYCTANCKGLQWTTPGQTLSGCCGTCTTPPPTDPYLGGWRHKDQAAIAQADSEYLEVRSGRLLDGWVEARQFQDRTIAGKLSRAMPQALVREIQTAISGYKLMFHENRLPS